MTFLSWAAASAALLASADENRTPTAELNGHTLRVERTTTAPWQRENGQIARSLTITFAVEPKDARKSYAYEIGQCFRARDAKGNEIPLDHTQIVGFEPAFRLAGFPPAPKANGPNVARDALTTSIPVASAEVDQIATLEGDLFVSDVELLEFKFTRNELDPNFVKYNGAVEAKLYLYDEQRRGVDVGFKFRWPERSYSRVLAGAGNPARDHVLLFADHGGVLTRLTAPGSGNGDLIEIGNGRRIRVFREFHRVELDRKPDALHVVLPRIEYPRRLPFVVKDVPVPAPVQPGIRGRGAPRGDRGADRSPPK